MEEALDAVVEEISDNDDLQEEIENTVEEYISLLGVVEMFVGLVGNMMLQSVLWTDVMVYVARQDDVKMRKLTSDLLG